MGRMDLQRPGRLIGGVLLRLPHFQSLVLSPSKRAQEMLQFNNMLPRFSVEHLLNSPSQIPWNYSSKTSKLMLYMKYLQNSGEQTVVLVGVLITQDTEKSNS